MKQNVGCKVKKTGKKSLMTMDQDDLINKIEKIFGESAAKMQIYGVPAGTGEHIKRPKEGEPTIDKSE